jgi:hypothetical protein
VGGGVNFQYYFVLNWFIEHVEPAQAAIEFVVLLGFNSPLAMHYFVVYLGRAA